MKKNDGMILSREAASKCLVISTAPNISTEFLAPAHIVHNITLTRQNLLLLIERK